MGTLQAVVLTDVVASTQLNEELGDAAMAPVWQAHDRMARAPRKTVRQVRVL